MADGTHIEWTDASINPIRARRVGARGEIRMGWHCEHVSEACRHCYAEAINRDRFGTGLDYKPGHLAAKGGEVEIVFVDKPLRDMLRWRRPRRAFVCSMTDLFADFVPDWMIDRVFAAAALCPQHTIRILTKRPERMRAYMRRGDRVWAIFRAVRDYIDEEYRENARFVDDETPWPWPLPNVWLGVTAERQQEADERIPILLDTPAAKRFVSIEPMLGPVDLNDVSPNGIQSIDALIGRSTTPDYSGWATLDWVICGGESGPDARPMHPDWARTLRDQCAAAHVPFFFKQWGEWAPLGQNAGRYWPADTATACRLRTDGSRGVDGWPMQRVGKRAAGRLLDGVEHNAFPEG